MCQDPQQRVVSDDDLEQQDLIKLMRFSKMHGSTDKNSSRPESTIKKQQTDVRHNEMIKTSEINQRDQCRSLGRMFDAADFKKTMNESQHSREKPV